MDAHPKKEALPIATPTAIIPCDTIRSSFDIPTSFSKMPSRVPFSVAGRGGGGALDGRRAE